MAWNLKTLQNPMANPSFNARYGSNIPNYHPTPFSAIPRSHLYTVPYQNAYSHSFPRTCFQPIAPGFFPETKNQPTGVQQPVSGQNTSSKEVSSYKGNKRIFSPTNSVQDKLSFGDANPEKKPCFLPFEDEYDCKDLLFEEGRLDYSRRHRFSVDSESHDNNSMSPFKGGVADDVLSTSTHEEDNKQESQANQPQVEADENTCPLCQKFFNRRWHVKRHIEKVHFRKVKPKIQKKKAPQSKTNTKNKKGKIALKNSTPDDKSDVTSTTMLDPVTGEIKKTSVKNNKGKAKKQLKKKPQKNSGKISMDQNIKAPFSPTITTSTGEKESVHDVDHTNSSSPWKKPSMPFCETRNRSDPSAAPKTPKPTVFSNLPDASNPLLGQDQQLTCSTWHLHNEYDNCEDFTSDSLLSTISLYSRSYQILCNPNGYY